MKAFFGFCGAALLLSCPLAAALAGPDDIVPRGHPVYDLLGRADPSLRRGDVLITRREAADRLEKLPHEGALWAALTREFGGEAPSKERPSGSGSATARTASGPDVLGANGKNLSVRLAGAAPVGASYVTAMAGDGWRGRRGYPAVESAYLSLPGKALDLTVGKKPLRWGPGYTGGLLLSDEAPSFAQVSVEKSFAVPGIGRRLGRLRFEQFYGQSFEADIASAPANARGTRRSLGGRRLSTDGDGRWNFALAETFKATRLPSAAFSQILPYYGYQNDWTVSSKRRYFPFISPRDRQPNTSWFNYQADVTASYRSKSGLTSYLDYLLDDIRAPAGLGQNGRVPPRTGLLVGVHAPDLGADKRFGARLEYARLDPLTYTNVSAPITWERGGQPLGYNAGGNVRVLFGRLDARLSARDGAALEVRSQRPVTLAPEQPAFFTPRREDRVSVYAHHALTGNGSRFVGVRLDSVRGAARGTRAEVSFGDAW